MLYSDSPGGATLGIFGYECAAGTLEPVSLYMLQLVQLNFATLYLTKLPKSSLS